MNKMELETIKTTKEVKYKFDRLQLDLRHKNILRTQSELVNLLIDTFKQSDKLMAKYLKENEKVKALESELEKSQLTKIKSSTKPQKTNFEIFCECGNKLSGHEENNKCDACYCKENVK